MTMYFFVILFCACIDSARLLPFPVCYSKYVNILVIFDCQGEVQEQIQFVNELKVHLSNKYKMQLMQTTFMSAQYSEPQDYKRFRGDVCNRKSLCNAIPISDLMNMSKLPTAYSEDYLLMSFIFLFNMSQNQFNEMQNYSKNNSEAERNQDKQFHRFFVIQSFETLSALKIPPYVFYFKGSFSNLHSTNILSLMCVTKCLNYHFQYRNNDYISSFYHFNSTLNQTHNQAVDYCTKQNMYLLSLETMAEFVFISSVVENNSTFKNENKTTRLHLGLKSYGEIHRWNSGNTFLFSTIFPQADCFSVHLYTYYDGKSFSDYLEEINCDETLYDSAVVCECHEVNQEIYSQLTLRKLQYFSEDKYTLGHPFRFVRQLYDILETYLPTAQGCVVNMTYLDGSLQTYICGVNRQSEFNIKSNQNLTILLYNDVEIFTIQQVDISRCTLSSNSSNRINVIDQTLSIQVVSTKLHDTSGPIRTDNENTDNQNTDSNLCKIQNNLNRSQLEPLQCKSNFYYNHSVYKCIYNSAIFCEDYFYLSNCDNFSCPNQFFKCPNSFCILSSMINDGFRDCRLGEDEIEFDNKVCTGDIGYVLKDICLHSIFKYYASAFVSPNSYCDTPCPIDYVCLSSKTKARSAYDSTKFTLNGIEIAINLYNISNQIIAPILFSLPNIVFLKFKGSYCNIKSLDNELRYWKFSQLLILDLSYNSIDSSDGMRYLKKLTNLKLLNVSHNRNLKLDVNFTFPKSLEIIDLSYTKIQTLKRDLFENLTSLRHLNLSYTLVSKYIDIGLPEYFKLDTLRLEGVIITNIEPNFFQGLKIESGLWVKEFTLCCSVVLNTTITKDKCHASDISISSCDHLVGDTAKRFVIWIVALLTLTGNGIVLVDRIVLNRQIFKKAYDLFITGLAMSDFLMGLYLIIIASSDIYFSEMYGLKDFQWRNSNLCSLAGFLSTLSSEASTFFICLITLDRFLTIKYPFGDHRFNYTSQLLSFITIWVCSFVVALLPVSIPEWKIYSSNSLCLPMPFSSEKYNGWELSLVIFVVMNFVLFGFIAIGQLVIFLTYNKINRYNSIVRRNQSRRRQDLKIARKLAFVALTNFMCWVPIAILGLVSVLGHTFDHEIYAWVAVFVLPINSALNPIIYTLPAIYNKCSVSVISFSSDLNKDSISMKTL